MAGGVGHLLAAILDRRPQPRGILIDSPDVIEQASGFLRGRGMADRIERRAGDLFGELDARADVYTCEGGRERSPHEVHALMRDAGLKPGRVRHAGLMMLVEGIAP